MEPVYRDWNGIHMERMKMKKIFCAALLALLYSVANTILGPMIAAQKMEFDRSQIVPFVFCFLLCSAVLLFLLFVFPQLLLRIEKGRGSQYFYGIDERKLFPVVWAFIFVMWIPAYLILYPGVLAYDMISQVGSALGRITNNHHPVLHTWLIRFFLKTGDALLDDYEFGIGLLSLLQMLILSYALARLVLLLKKKKVPALLVVLTALFSAGWFMNACLSVTMIKDSLHAAFLVLFICHFTEIATNPSEYCKRRQNYPAFPVVSFLMCAFRNNGIYIYLFCFAVLLLLRISKINKARSYAALIVVILLPPLMYQIYTGPVFDAFDIAQTESREALSVPIQQLQRVAVKRAAELTDEQTERMSYYIDNLEWMTTPVQNYDPFIADPAKSCFYSEHYDNDPRAFWKFYLQIGKQFTKEYVAAFLSNTLGYWYPGYFEYSYVIYENYPSEMFEEPLERKSIWNSQILKKYYESVCSSDFWRKTPFLRMFFVPGFTIWFLLCALLSAWEKPSFYTRVFPIFLPLIAQYGIMLLSPMSSFRYSWPLYLMLPLAFIAIWGNSGAQTVETVNAETHLEV